MQGDPLVSIRCLVYNHEPFLRQCLDGFVMQQTTFPFEAIVHDDASTDGSAAIIREYAEKYPDIIKPIYETENQYCKHGSLMKIIDDHIHPAAKYIAVCEGDDYWTDHLKLQKQVDFLEGHPDFVLCSGNYRCYYQNEMEFDGKAVYDWLFVGDRIDNAFFEYSLDNYFEDWWVRTLTCVYKRYAYGEEIRSKGYNFLRDDIFYYNVLTHGKGALLKDVLGVYRVHSGGVWSGMQKVDRLREQLAHAFLIYQIEGDKRAFTKTRRCTIRLLDELKTNGEKGYYLNELKKYYRNAPLSEFCSLVVAILRGRLSNVYHHIR